MAAFKGDHASHVLAREIIDDPDRAILLSDLVRLEVLPKAVFHNSNEEAGFYEDVFEDAEVVASTSEGAVARALELAKQYGLNAFDACVAECAITLSADEFVTTEKLTKPFFRIETTKTKFVSICPT